jgi:hypothetical protein
MYDFPNRINEAKRAVERSYNTYNKYEGDAAQAKQNLDANMGQTKDYSTLYDEARAKYGNTDEIQRAFNSLKNARGVVDELNTTISKMPESIRQQYSGTGMTEAQRQRALGAQMNAQQPILQNATTTYQNASNDYNSLIERALREAQQVAGGNMSYQTNTTNNLMNIWSTLLGQRNTAYNENLQDRGLLANQYGAKDQWDLAQQKDALDRWKEQQANYRQKLDSDSRLEAARLSRYLPGRGGNNNNGKPGNNNNGKPGNNNAYTPRKRQGPIYATKANNLWDAIKMYGPLAALGGGTFWANKGIEDRWGGQSSGNGGGDW